MKIGVDLRVLGTLKLTGVGIYTLAVLLELFKLDQKNHYKLFYNSLSPLPAEILSKFAGLAKVELFVFKYPNKFLNGCLTFLNRPRLDKLIKGADLFWFPNLNFWTLSNNCKTVVTIHDLSFERIPWAYSTKMRLWHQAISPRQKLVKADKIIAVSENTKRDLMDLYGLQEAKISVVYLGVSKNNEPPLNLQAIKDRYRLPEKFILYLGTLEPRKNIKGVIRAYELLNQPEYSLVIAGGRGWLYQKIYKLAEKSKFKEHIKFINYIKPEDRFSLYRLASLFVWPSFYEGFGFPPLEAMANGCPVISSFNSSLPEVLGQAALLVDPYNIKEIAKAMKLLLEDNPLRQKLIHQGYEQVKKFNWQETAKQMLDVFQTI